MLQFNRVILHNFGSYGHAEVELHDKGFCLVSGRNLYKRDNAFSNGSGKSFIWNAICFALTGETLNGLHSNLKNINADENDKACFVTLDFKSNGDNFVITRYIAPSSDLKIFKNSVDVSGKGIRLSEKKLGELLPDLTKDLIASTILIGQGMPNKFSSFSPSGRKELLEKLTKSDFMIDDLKTRVASRVSELTRMERTYEDSQLVNKVELNSLQNKYNKVVEDLNNITVPNYVELISNNTDLLKSIEARLGEISELSIASNNDVAAAEAKYRDLASERLKVSNEEMTAYNTAYSALTKTQTECEFEIRSLSAEIKRLESITDICPTCGQKLKNVQKPDTTEAHNKLDSLQAKLTEIKNQVTTCNTQHQEYQNQINESFDNELKELLNISEGYKKIARNLQTENNELLVKKSKTEQEISSLTYESQNYQKNINNLQQLKTDMTSQIMALESAITLTSNGLLQTQEHLAVVKKMETLLKRDFRGYLLTNIINYIDAKAKEYCKIVFETEDLKVYLDGNALDISYCGKMFDNLSGGEKQRVDLILQFAIRDMLISYLGLNSNILVLDEITDFLDKQSCSAIMKLIERELNTIESVFIISHHAEELELPIDSELHVIKNENGISEVY